MGTASKAARPKVASGCSHTDLRSIVEVRDALSAIKLAGDRFLLCLIPEAELLGIEDRCRQRTPIRMTVG
jgi:hypothetical protein